MRKVLVYLNQIKDSSPSTQNTYQYAKLIYDLYIKRSLVGISQNIIHETFDTNTVEAIAPLSPVFTTGLYTNPCSQTFHSISLGRTIQGWDHFTLILVSVSDRFGVTLGLIWDHFEIMLGSF